MEQEIQRLRQEAAEHRRAASALRSSSLFVIHVSSAPVAALTAAEPAVEPVTAKENAHAPSDYVAPQQPVPCIPKPFTGYENRTFMHAARRKALEERQRRLDREAAQRLLAAVDMQSVDSESHIEYDNNSDHDMKFPLSRRLHEAPRRRTPTAQSSNPDQARFASQLRAARGSTRQRNPVISHSHRFPSEQSSVDDCNASAIPPCPSHVAADGPGFDAFDDELSVAWQPPAVDEYIANMEQRVADVQARRRALIGHPLVSSVEPSRVPSPNTLQIDLPILTARSEAIERRKAALVPRSMVEPVLSSDSSAQAGQHVVSLLPVPPLPRSLPPRPTIAVAHHARPKYQPPPTPPQVVAMRERAAEVKQRAAARQARREEAAAAAARAKADADAAALEAEKQKKVERIRQHALEAASKAADESALLAAQRHYRAVLMHKAWGCWWTRVRTMKQCETIAWHHFSTSASYALCNALPSSCLPFSECLMQLCLRPSQRTRNCLDAWLVATRFFQYRRCCLNVLLCRSLLRHCFMSWHVLARRTCGARFVERIILRGQQRHAFSVWQHSTAQVRTIGACMIASSVIFSKLKFILIIALQSY